MGKRLNEWIKEYREQMEEHEIAAGLGNGEIEIPGWLSYSPCTGIGFAIWDNEESDGTHALYNLDTDQPDDC